MSIADHPDAIAKAVFVLEGETDEQQAAVIHRDGALWLVATWLRSSAGKLHPERLVPLEKLEPEFDLVLRLYRLGRRIPKPLFEASVATELLAAWGVQIHPGTAHIPAPDGIQ